METDYQNREKFVKSNDIIGKTVIPFCTLTSSGLGKSGELLAEMAGAGEKIVMAFFL